MSKLSESDTDSDLWRAARRNDLKGARRYPARQDVVDGRGWTPLNEAACHTEPTVLLLLEPCDGETSLSGDVNDIDDIEGRNPVMETVHQNHVDAVCAGQECVTLDMVDGKRPNEAVPDITGTGDSGSAEQTSPDSGNYSLVHSHPLLSPGTGDSGSAEQTSPDSGNYSLVHSHPLLNSDFEMTENVYEEFRTKVLGQPLPDYLCVMYFHPPVKKICIDVLEGNLTAAKEYFQHLDPYLYSNGFIDIGETGSIVFCVRPKLCAIKTLTGKNPGDELQKMQGGSKLYVSTNWYDNRIGNSSAATSTASKVMTGTLGALLQVNSIEEDSTTMENLDGKSLKKRDAESMAKSDDKSINSYDDESMEKPDEKPDDKSMAKPDDEISANPIDESKTKFDDESMEKPDDESMEKSDDKSMEKFDDKSMKMPDDKSKDKSDDISIEIHNDKSTENPDYKSMERPDEESMVKSEYKSMVRSDDKSMVRSDYKSTEQPDDKSIEKPDDKSIERPDEKSMEKPDDKSIERSDDKSMYRPDEKNIEMPDDKSKEKLESIEKPDDKSTKRPDDKSMERPDEKSMEKPDDKSMVRSDDKSMKKSDEKSKERSGDKSMDKPDDQIMENLDDKSKTNPDDKSMEKTDKHEYKNIQFEYLKFDEKIDNRSITKPNSDHITNSNEKGKEHADVKADDKILRNPDYERFAKSKKEQNKRCLYGITAKHIFYPLNELKFKPKEMMSILEGTELVESVEICCRASVTENEGTEEIPCLLAANKFYGIFSGYNYISLDVSLSKDTFLDVAVFPILEDVDASCINEYFRNDRGDMVNLLVYRGSDADLIDVEVQAIGALSGERSEDNPTGATYGKIVAAGMDLIDDSKLLGSRVFYAVKTDISSERPFVENGDSGCLITGRIGNSTEVFVYGILSSIREWVTCRSKDNVNKLYRTVAVCTRLDVSLDAIRNVWGINLDFVRRTSNAATDEPELKGDASEQARQDDSVSQSADKMSMPSTSGLSYEKPDQLSPHPKNVNISPQCSENLSDFNLDDAHVGRIKYADTGMNVDEFRKLMLQPNREHSGLSLRS